MNRLTAFAALASVAAWATASAQIATPRRQGPDLTAQRAAIERLAGMVGDWQGVAKVAFPAPSTVHQTERVERALDGLLLVIHGAGYASPDRAGAPIFRAMGVISYDDSRRKYEFRAYNDGRAVTAEADVLDDGRLRWIMNFAPVLIRYTITLEGDTWREIGEMSRDNGATWTPTMEMNLSRVT
jgi:hypothetical protein